MTLNLRQQVRLRRDALDTHQLQLAESMVELLKDLPPLSHTVAAVLALLDEADVSLGQVAAAVNKDPALASRVLKLASSPMFFRGTAATTIPHAMSILGIARLRAVVVAAQMEALRHSFEGPQSQELEALQHEIWRNSLCTAVAANHIARMARKSYAEELFLSGLLHDLGKHALLFLMPSKYADVMSQISPASSLVERETELIGFSHTLVGTFAAQKWLFPVDLCEIIRIHHQRFSMPFRSQLVEKAALVQCADLVAHALGHGYRCKDPALKAELSAALARFDINPAQTEELLEEIGALFRKEL